MTIQRINPLDVRLGGRVTASGSSAPSEPPSAAKRDADLRAAKDLSTAPRDGDALKARARLLIEQARLSLKRPGGEGK